MPFLPWGQHLEKLVRDHDGTEWRLPRGEAFGAVVDISLGDEEVPKMTEFGGHLVGNSWYAVSAADRLNGGVVALEDHQHAAAAHDQLGDKSRDIARADALNAFLEFLDLVVAVDRLAHALSVTGAVGLAKVGHQSRVSNSQSLLAMPVRLAER